MKTGQLFKIRDPHIQAELAQIHRLLQGKVSSANLNLTEVAAALGKAFGDWQNSPWARFMKAQSDAWGLRVVQEEDQYCLYASKPSIGSATKEALYSTLDDASLYTAKMVQEGNGGVLYLDGRNDTVPILWLQSGAGSGKIIDSSSGAYLSFDGFWQDSSSEKTKRFFFMPEPQKVLKAIDDLYVGVYERKRPETGFPMGTRHIGPSAEDFETLFGVGDGIGLSPLDVASAGLVGIKALSDRIKELETRIELLEGKNNGTGRF
jgi:hypothetical protein